MVTIMDGRFDLPDHLYYTQNQHIYLDKAKRRLGLDEIGYAFMKNPREVTFLVESKIKMGETFATITTDQGITSLLSPCSGRIKQLNENALEFMEYDPYQQGYLVELEEINELHPALIYGNKIEQWGISEAHSLLRNTFSFKIIEIGDTTVGKTAIKVRFTDDYFKKDLKSTLGVDFGSKEIKGEYLSGDILFSGTYRYTAKLNIWDAAGQEHFDKIRGVYYRDAKGVIIVYDINNRVTFNNLEKWINEMEEYLGTNLPVLLVGNKLDLDRAVSRHEGLDFAIKHNFLFMECSAKTGDNVGMVFEKLALEIFKKEEGLE